MNSLFSAYEPKLPGGFQYHPAFLTRDEEAALLESFKKLPFSNSRYHEYTALRRTVSFSLSWDDLDRDGLHNGSVGRLIAPPFSRPPYGEAEPASKPPAPLILAELVRRVAAFVGRSPRVFPHVLVTEYPPGAPMGWHRDAPPCREIFGVSLGADCGFWLRPQAEELRRLASLHKLTAERRSLYVMAGPSRSDWQHCIPPVKALRYSVTLRTV